MTLSVRFIAFTVIFLEKIAVLPFVIRSRLLVAPNFRKRHSRAETVPWRRWPWRCASSTFTKR